MRSGAIVNAQVRPMRDPSASARPWQEVHEAIAWEAGLVVAVGTNEAILGEARKRGLQVDDAHGMAVLPGFVDAHTHFLHIGVKRHRPDLEGAASRAQALQRVAAWLASHPGPAPVIAERWDEASWPADDRRRPTRADLDAVVRAATAAGHGPSDRAVVIRRVCGHVAVASSGALPSIRRRWDTDDLVNRESGLVLEQASLYLNEVIPVPDTQLDMALVEATRECHALGITCVGDYSQAPYRRALQRAAQTGRLAMRVSSSIYPQQLDGELAMGFRTGRRHAGGFLQDGGLKVFLDGSLGARTAALRAPYGDAPAGLAPGCQGQRKSRHGCVGHPHPNGTLNWSDAETAAWFAKAHHAGVQIHAHAIGDASIDQGLEAFAAAMQDAPRGSPHAMRHRFEHFEVVHDDQAASARDLGVIASCQPNFVGTWSAPGGMYADRLGARLGLNNRFRAFLDHGIPVAFGSDGMPPGPLAGIAAAVQRQDAPQRLDAWEAVWHYTWWSSWALHWEDRIGSLEPGKAADFAIVDASSNDPADWGIKQTILDGIQVFHRP